MIHIYTSSQKWPLSITKYAINKIIHVYPFPHHILYPYMLTYGYDKKKLKCKYIYFSEISFLSLKLICYKWFDI